MRLLWIRDAPNADAELTARLRALCEPEALTILAGEALPAWGDDFNGLAFDVCLLDVSTPGARRSSAALWALRPRGPAAPPVVCRHVAQGRMMLPPAIREGAAALVASDATESLLEVLTRLAAERRARWARFKVSSEGETAFRFGAVRVPGLYRLRSLAMNSIAAVFLAERERDGRVVVVKTVLNGSGSAGNTLDRFLQEYEIIRRLRHPDVVEILDLGASDEGVYLVMEHCTGGDLRQRIKREGVLPWREAVGILRHVAVALAAIHEAGVLHRDLKPGNVMFRADGSVALIDFGLAKQVAIDAEITGSTEIFGTPHYMSPEQGHGRPCDERSDLYSLGVMFFEMLTGRKPYHAASPMALIYKHSHEPLPELPAAFATWQPVLNALLQKDPAARFGSAHELIASIDRVMATAVA
jgi:eukaryotic-like serine/threonine-protein kinase